VNEAYKHCKALAATGAGVELLRASSIVTGDDGRMEAEAQAASGDEAVVVGSDTQARSVADAFIKAIANHRNWAREKTHPVPA
jgi:catalase